MLAISYPEAFQEVNHTCWDTAHTWKPYTTMLNESVDPSHRTPLRPGPQLIRSSSCSAWAEPPVWLNNSKLGGQGTKGGKATALPFLTSPHVQVVVRLTSRSANSEVRASSIHSPAAGYTSPLPNVWKSASRADLLAPREAL